MVDMLTEENRQLKQEMEVCGEKVSKLQKVSLPVCGLQLHLNEKCALMLIKNIIFFSFVARD